jgi:hypothetical protein
MLLPILIVVVALVAFGVWRRFGAIQWIWLLFGAAIALVLAWAAMLAFVIGPEMRKRGPSAPERRMPVGHADVAAPAVAVTMEGAVLPAAAVRPPLRDRSVYFASL